MPNETTGSDLPPHSRPRIRLVGGVNFTTWPDLKWSRARSHIASLQSKIDEWHASFPMSVDATLREDGQSVDLTARVPRGIPQHEWALDLGDAIHNLRSAFDAMAWGIAHFNGAQPTNPKAVYFPVCMEPKQWKKALNDWVGDINPEFQERLRIMQPFTYMPTGGASVLSMLHELDIQDKHKDSLAVSADLDEIDVSSSFQLEDADAETSLRIDMASGVAFGDGVLLGTVHVGAPIRMVGNATYRPAIRVQLTHDGETRDVMSMLQQFVLETRRCLDILQSGLADPDDDDGWETVETNLRPA